MERLEAAHLIDKAIVALEKNRNDVAAQIAALRRARLAIMSRDGELSAKLDAIANEFKKTEAA